ncbi:MAG: tripartite tricarboxylate transporter TctB family protein [Planctomycetes bacterium]|nr:tripartite tricarboxylate transporter TctB family protein [Planctomycetota bacterium]
MRTVSTIRIVAVVVIAIAGYAFYLTLGYPRGAAILPRALTVLLALCAAALLVRGPGPDGVGRSLGIKHHGRVLFGAGLCVGYVAGIHVLGYYLASAVFVVALSQVLRYRKWAYVAATAIGYPLAIYLVFEYLLKIPMPQPIWY